MTLLRQQGDRKDTGTIRLPNGRRIQIKNGIVELPRRGSIDFLLSPRAERRYGYKFERIPEEKKEEIVAPLVAEEPVKPISIAYVTAITGKKDTFKTPSKLDENVHYYLFLDAIKKPINGKVKKRPIPDNPEFFEDINNSIKELKPKDRICAKNLLIAQKIRILSANLNLLDKEYDIVVWHDASIFIKKVPFFIFDEMIENNTLLAMYAHFRSNCIYDEIDQWNREDHYFKIARDRTLKRYKEIKFPIKYGSWGGGVHVQNRKEPETKVIMNHWWHDIINITISDQLSIPFVLNKYQFKFKTIGKQLGMEHNKFFKWKGHHG